MFLCVIRECQSGNSIHVPQHKNRDITTQVSTASAVLSDNVDKISTPRSFSQYGCYLDR